MKRGLLGFEGDFDGNCGTLHVRNPFWGLLKAENIAGEAKRRWRESIDHICLDTGLHLNRVS